MIADLRLRPEAEATINEHPHINAGSNSVSAMFCRTDMSNWRDISEMWETTTRDFGRVDIVVNGAGIYEPPSSSFWNPPGISARSKDPQDADVGQYKTFAVNTIGSTRLAQIAIDYWQQHPDIQGNILFIASMGGYLHSIHTPLYFASKAAIVSLVKSLGGLKEVLGIRMAAVCPGPVLVSGFCRQRYVNHTDKNPDAHFWAGILQGQTPSRRCSINSRAMCRICIAGFAGASIWEG